MTPRSEFQFDAFIGDDEIIVDSFAGGGGASLGIQWALGRGPHIAINHDKEAIALHAANHPESEHFPEDVWHVDPVVACRGRKVGLMWLSPDCKHFSKAKGGKPVSKKIRGLAWTACRWAKAVRPRVIVLENVEEFKDWGPLIKVDGQWRPDPEKKGFTFNRFVARLRRLGYVVEWKELRACDFGAPTIRKRFFLIARGDGRPIVWPKPTHGKAHAQPWRTAAECIDWSIPCPSIFERKKPLAINTQKRIARGIKRYVIDSPKPFIVQYHSARRDGDDRVASIEDPLNTQTIENRFAIATPIVTPIDNLSSGEAGARSGNDPLSTITAEARHAIVTPTLVHFKSDAPGDVNAPVPTQTARDCFGLVAPILAGVGGRAGQSPERSLEQPVQTITAKGDSALVTPIVMPLTHHDEQRGQRADAPLATITGAHRGEHALVSGFLKPRYGEDPDPARRGGLGQAPRVRSLDEPMPVIVPTANGGDLVAAFMAQHNTDVVGHAMSEPVSTIVGKGCTQAPVSVTLQTAAHITKFRADSAGSDIEQPMPTVTANSYIKRPGGAAPLGVVASTLINMRGTADNQIGGRSIDEPLPTISGGGIHAAEVRAFLISYYGTEQTSGNLHSPAPTVTSKERFGLVTIAGVEYAIVDIGMRMLAPRELYTAQGFPTSYRIEIPYTYTVTRTRKGKKVKVTVTKPLTKTAQVRMCGNSVCPPMAAAIVGANLLGETFAPNRSREWAAFLEQETRAGMVAAGALEDVA